MQPGIFAQLVVVPLFTDHRILSQVAGHSVNVVKGLPPLTITEEDVDWFATALDEVVGEAQKMGALDDELRAPRGARRPQEAPPPVASPLRAAPSGSSARETISAGEAPGGDDRDLLPVRPDRLVQQHDVRASAG